MADKQPEPIAIVGMACRLPGSVSHPGEFYRMLCRQKTGWSKIPPGRFNAEAYHHPNPDKKGCINSEGGYFIKDDISMFDAAFFDITRKEAESMDPAQRLLLECVYEALENAGIPKETVSGEKIGVFVGANYSEHRVGNLRDLDHIPSFDATGNQGAFLAGRVAYYFNLHGPTLTVDTACSSSMHALHLAVQSIRAGESEQAIVGASHLITHPDIWVSMGKLRLFSNSGRTYAFDNRAKSGYARGEGAGCLVLKPLARAQADNDHVFSVITHSGASHNGRTIGIVAPSPEEQEKLVKRVLAEASIDPCDVGFFEAHGTGTKKGDPIEATGIYQAVGRYFTPENPLYIGSVKPNIGHLECASGVVSVIKSVLMLYYGFILPNADFKWTNKAIPLDEWNMRVATQQKPWPAKRKYVCVNNFGFSGSNSMCVLQAAPQIRGLEVGDNSSYSPLRLFVLSANDETALQHSIRKLGIWIEQHAELYQTTMPRNLAYTLCQRRSHLPWRVAVVANMCSSVASALNSHDTVPARAPSEPPRLAFVYTGQGAQWFAMGRELLGTHPVFFDAVSRADAVLRALGADFSVLEELHRDKTSSRVGLARISQPICTAVQLALTELFAAFGVRPAAVTGHSSGEIAAAYAAGALTFESAMAAAYHRGHIIVELKERYPNLRGSMMAVGAGADELSPMLQELNEGGGPQVVVACENSPSSTTLSGDEEAIDRVGKLFQDKGVFNRKLFVDVAYHSPHMQLIAESYLAQVSHIEAPVGGTSSGVEFFSSLHGRKISLGELGPQYWVDNLTRTVRFSTAIQKLCTEYRPDILLEIGPHAALKGPIMQALKRLGSAALKISYLPSLIRGEDAARTCLETAGQLFVRGHPLNFFEINHNREENEKPEVVPVLYTYPWSRQRYWYESRLSRQHRLKPFPRNDLLGALADWSSALDPTWRNVIRTEDLPWLKEYQVQSRMVFPVSGFISMVVEAAAQTACLNETDAAMFEIKSLRISEHLYLADGQEFELLLNFRPLDTGDRTGHAFRISSYEANRNWLEHCTGIVTVKLNSSSAPASVGAENGRALSRAGTKSFSTFQNGSTDSGSAQPRASDKGSDIGNGLLKPSQKNSSQMDMYKRLESRSLSFPASFKSLVGTIMRKSRVRAHCVVRNTRSHMPLEHETPYTIHPAVLDAMLQIPLLYPDAKSEVKTSDAACLPSSIRHMIIRSHWTHKSGDSFEVSAAPEPKTASFMVELFSAAGAAAAVSMSGLKFKPLECKPQEPPSPRQLCYKTTWEPLNKTTEIDEVARRHIAGADKAIVIVTERGRDTEDPLVTLLIRKLKECTTVPVVACSLGAIDDWNNYFIVLCELRTPILYPIDQARFDQVIALLTEAPGLMWVTRGATRFPTSPSASLALGLTRTARSERNAVASTLDLTAFSRLHITRQAELIRNAFGVSVLSGGEAAEMEFAEEAGELIVPRIVPDAELNLDVHRSLGQSAPYHQAIHQPERQFRLSRQIDASSGDELYFEDAADVPLEDNEVELLVEASALTQDDITSGTVGDEPSTTIPRSCAGTITRVGRAVGNIRVGDRVCALAEGPFGTHARARRTSVAIIPDTIRSKTAACIPGPLLAAYYALVNTANVRQGERVLVQLSGPAGLAAVAVARHLRASLYALILDEQQGALARKIGLPPERILDARSIYFRQELEEATQGRGMEVVLALSGQGTASAWECLANFGRFVEIRTPGAHERTRPELGINATFSSVNMINIAAERPEAMSILGVVVHKVATGAITPPTTITKAPISQLHRGIRMVRDGAVESVVALIGDGTEQVRALHRVSRSIFRSNGTHLIIGGTGGLGRSMARYMVEHGARNIVLVSRSGGGGDAVDELQRKMQRSGARLVVMKCDVTDEGQVRQLIEACQRSLPPICGVIHAAMVLRDVLLENMSHAEYQQVIQPKVLGATNIHTALTATRVKLDYFVILSSAAGILGSRGQGAYAAANTFLDSFAQYLVERGVPGTALDLTAVTGAGYLAKNAERQEEIIRNFGNESVSEDEVLALLSAAVRGMCGPQCLTGLKLHLGRDGQWPYYANDARFAHLKAESLAAAEREGLVPRQAVSPGAAFRAANSDKEATHIAAQGVAEKLSEVLTIAVEDLDVARNITSYGLDSLTAIELRNWIAKEFRTNLQILELLSSGTINDLAGLIVQKARTACADEKPCKSPV
ncbi:polyketide synthase [Thermothelomyces thermophilus ATCC 42464]|uniref:Polyketide synthase n=1 Tax=Thermothelomyces thermophilus (strain ATCC 42464 / BCRC 31852 / DSM 1799) TaxID=573729 RepID=G2QJ19_THET4|nr:polyketide synthase [Thermothelomyces thermophilus ATCC 42464]AEO60438.1 polyketide synthase [Thermothelomyces thermophilus ATCC 42464]